MSCKADSGYVAICLSMAERIDSVSMVWLKRLKEPAKANISKSFLITP
jgi:hypothetical protein